MIINNTILLDNYSFNQICIVSKCCANSKYLTFDNEPNNGKLKINFDDLLNVIDEYKIINVFCYVGRSSQIY